MSDKTVASPDPMQELVEETERLGLYDSPKTTPDGELRKLFFDWFQEIVDQINGDILRDEMYAALSRAEFLSKVEKTM